MQKLLFRVLGFLCLAPSWLLAQQYQNPNIEYFGTPNEVNLGAPNPNEGIDLIPSGIDLYSGDDPNTIYYGLTPPNSASKPVIVFVHGYASKASVWYTGDDNMYKDVYNNGYRTAFVSLTPNKHVWTNGSMLATIIDRVTQHYAVNDVVVVGWSKGGVDTDAAVVHFGANAKVSKVITLSSPHNGTYLAELGNSWLLSLVNIIFMQNNDATKSLTRGNMAYFRSITDSHPGNTVPFTTFGAWGNGPLNRVDIPQGILHLNGGSKSSGGNDGVVPYSSSLRPGSQELFGGQYKAYGWFWIPYYPGPNETELDHFEVTRGGLTWSYIRGVINGALRIRPQRTPQDYYPNAVAHSNFQLVTADPAASSFVVEENSSVLQVHILAQEGKTWTAIDAQGNSFSPTFLNDQYLEFSGLQPGAYTLTHSGEFAALISSESEVQAHLNTGASADQPVYPEKTEMRFSLDWTNATSADLQDMEVTGLLNRTQNLQMESRDEAPLVLTFTREGNQYVTSAPATLPGGIYSLTVRAEGKHLSRTIVTSIAKLGNDKPATETLASTLDLTVGPNPFSDRLSIYVESVNPGTVTVYNMVGKPLAQMDHDPTSGSQTLTWDARAEGYSAGVYLVEFSDGKQKLMRKVVLQ